MKSPLGLRRFLLSVALSVFVGALGSLALACNVPVFRYALEHWRPDAYRAVLFHRGALSATDQERLAALQGEISTSQVNLSIQSVDLDASPDPSDRELAKFAGSAELPRLVVQYPAYLQLDQPIFSGPFGESELSTLLDSQSRRELLQRLTAGQTAVWIMVDSGDSRQDDIAAATLETELKQLEKTLKLPELTDSPEDIIQDGPPVRLEFSVLRIRRDDSAEQALIAMLMGCEADLSTLNEPMVFPVFGRGRALLPLVGPGISPNNIRDSATFLAGACSCQVKELNPGFDLLLTADWKELLSWAKSPAFASGESPASRSGDPELVPIPGGSESRLVPQLATPPEPNSQPVAAKAASVSTPKSAFADGFTMTLMIVAGIVLAGAVLAVMRMTRA